MELYIARDGQTHGPYEESEIRVYLQQGAFTAADLATPVGEEQWRPLGAILPSSRSYRSMEPGVSRDDGRKIANPERPIRIPGWMWFLLVAAGLWGVWQFGLATWRLEHGYKAAAENLRANLVTALTDQGVEDDILQRDREAEDSSNKAMRMADARLGKQPVEGRPIADKVLVESISVVPPELVKDENDLYKRYKSSVKITVRIANSQGHLVCSIPVSANPSEQWNFPNTSAALASVKEAFDHEASITSKYTISLLDTLSGN